MYVHVFFLLRTLTLHYHRPDVMGHLTSQQVRLHQHIARIQSESLRNRKDSEGDISWYSKC